MKQTEWKMTFPFLRNKLQVYLQNFKPGTIKTKLFNYFAGMWCAWVYIGEKSHFTFHFPLLCLILAVSVLQDSSILIIFLISCKPQGTWYQTDQPTRIPNGNNNAMRDPAKNSPLRSLLLNRICNLYNFPEIVTYSRLFSFHCFSEKFIKHAWNGCSQDGYHAVWHISSMCFALCFIFSSHCSNTNFPWICKTIDLDQSVLSMVKAFGAEISKTPKFHTFHGHWCYHS